MAIPPKDDDGIVKPHDDGNILNEDGLLRQIDPEHHVCWDDNNGCYRVSSAAFKESQKNAPYGGMSVDIESLVIADSISPDQRAFGRNGLVKLIVGKMRTLGFQVGTDPIKNHPVYPDNPYHGEVWGIKKGMRKKTVKETILASYEWVKRINDVQ